MMNVKITSRWLIAHRRRSSMLIVLALAAGLVLGWRNLGIAQNSVPVAQSTARSAIPVTDARAQLKDVPIYLTTVGNVQAYNTVSIKTRVDGQLDSVNFIEGQYVKMGDVLAHIDPRTYQAQLEQAIAKKAFDQAQLSNAQRDLARYTYLSKQNAIAMQMLDTQRSLVDQLTAQIKLDQGAIDSARTFLDYCTITSPIDGRTGIRLVDKGNIVHATDTTGLVVVTQLHPISVLFSLPEQYLAELFAAQSSGPIKVSVQDRADGHRLDEGTVALIDNQIAQGAGSVPLKATFANTNNALWPGQFVNVRLLLRVNKSAVTVPATAVQRGPDGMYVYGIDAKHTVRMIPVQVPNISDGVALVAQGLAAGTQVVSTGQYRLQPGALVRILGKPGRS